MSSQESGAESELDNDISVESIKTIASSYGITKLNDEALQFLLDDVNFRLKEISQVSFNAILYFCGKYCDLIYKVNTNYHMHVSCVVCFAL